MRYAASRPFLALLLGLLLLPAAGDTVLAKPPGSQAMPEPTESQERTGQMIAELLTRHHYREHKLDDQLSEYVFDAYFDALDPERYYFLQSDVDQFKKYRDRLDDLLADGHIDVAYRIFGLYRQRVTQRSQYAISMLRSELNFAEDATFELDRTDAPWAKNQDQLETLWRHRVKHDALTLKLAGEKWPEIKKTLIDRYQRLTRSTRQYNAEDVFQVFMNAWSHAFDPHTSYMSPRSSENFDINMRLSLEGIGALLKSDKDYTKIVELIPGGPAAKNGELHPGDRIIGVAQGDADMTDVVGWRLSDVVELIRGPKDSVVRLRVLPAEGGANSKPEVVKLVRGKVKLSEQAAQSRVLEVKHNGRPVRIGVIDIPAFYIDFAAAQAGDKDYRSTTRDVRRLLEGLETKHIGGLVIDLRSNAGGSLREAIDLTGLFIDQGPVVQIRRSDGTLQVESDDDGGQVAYDGPLAVLVNGYSASASEIFAGAIQDYQRGVIVGSRTFGKGTVQRLVDLGQFGLSDKTAGRLKLTVAKFYRVTGKSTQRVGVEPDIKLPSPVDSQEVGESAEDNALPWDQISAAEFHRMNSLSSGIIPRLRADYEHRESHDKALKALTEEYAFLRQQRSQNVIPLNEAKLRREQRQAKQRRLALINERLQAMGHKPVDSVDALDDKDLPDLLLQTTAGIVADLHDIKQSAVAESDHPMDASVGKR